MPGLSCQFHCLWRGKGGGGAWKARAACTSCATLEREAAGMGGVVMKLTRGAPNHKSVEDLIEGIGIPNEAPQTTHADAQ